MAALTPKQQRFVDEYLVDLNGTQAAIRAGYAARSADVTAARLLGNASVQAAVSAGQAAQQKRTQVTADRLVDELALIAFSDLGQVLDFSGPVPRLRPANEISEAARRALASVKVRREAGGEDDPPADVVEFKLWPKLDAIDKLARRLGFYAPEKVDLNLKTVPAEDLDDDSLLAIARGAGPQGGGARPGRGRKGAAAP